MEYQMGRLSWHYTNKVFLKLRSFFTRVLSIKCNKTISLQKPFTEQILEGLLNFSDQHKRVNKPFNTAHTAQGKVPKKTLRTETIR